MVLTRPARTLREMAYVSAEARQQLLDNIAEAIDEFCRTQEVMDVSGQRNRGVLNGDDMARWQASYSGGPERPPRPPRRAGASRPSRPTSPSMSATG